MPRKGEVHSPDENSSKEVNLQLFRAKNMPDGGTRTGVIAIGATKLPWKARDARYRKSIKRAETYRKARLKDMTLVHGVIGPSIVALVKQAAWCHGVASIMMEEALSQDSDLRDRHCKEMLNMARQWMAEARTCELAISSLARYEGNDRARRAQEVEDLFEARENSKFITAEEAEFSEGQNDIPAGRADERGEGTAGETGGDDIKGVSAESPNQEP